MGLNYQPSYAIRNIAYSYGSKGTTIRLPDQVETVERHHLYGKDPFGREVFSATFAERANGKIGVWTTEGKAEHELKGVEFDVETAGQMYVDLLRAGFYTD